MESLPLFPLGTVLLPGVALPLRIFEPRYVALVAHLARVETPTFGVVAIRRGREVGDDAPELAGVGCAAEIVARNRVEDRLMIETVGRRRFRIEAVHTDRAPYLVGDVTWLEEGPADAVDVESVTAAFTSFTTSIGARVTGLPTEAGPLTMAVLDALGVSIAERQGVLEAGDAAARLAAVRRLCRREEAITRELHCRAAQVTPSSRLSPN